MEEQKGIVENSRKLPRGASGKATLNNYLHMKIYAYLNFKELVTKVSTLNKHERKALFHSKDNQGFLLRDKSKRPLKLKFRNGRLFAATSS